LKQQLVQQYEPGVMCHDGVISGLVLLVAASSTVTGKIRASAVGVNVQDR
jgi:hypothetical protein